MAAANDKGGAVLYLSFVAGGFKHGRTAFKLECFLAKDWSGFLFLLCFGVYLQSC
jgi:hypothetical protein